LRQGRYDHGAELNRQWFAEVEQVRAALKAWQPRGRVLELACGTGLWSQHLAKRAERLTLVDSSAEALALAKERLGPAEVELIEANIFDWRPTQRFDCVFFGFWLSHVPAERFAAFWNLVRDCLAPEGRVFFVDSRFTASSTARDHSLVSPQHSTVTRRLNDGREYTIVKIFYDTERLRSELAGLGWQAQIRATPEYFLFGSARFGEGQKR
jgi:ubiquinone/menaquinone biosynthesis C-methylase UbiE